MSTVLPGSKVLVTGVNGFVASWVAQKLLESGYSVRGTVRSEKKGVHFKKIFAEYGDKFEIAVVEDITKPGAFDEALKDVHAIQHVASPASFNFKEPSDGIDPAVRGTVGILESAATSGSTVKSIVITSSVAAVYGDNQKGVIDETSWNEDSPKIVESWRPGTEISPGDVYRASKVLAEKAAWSFYEKNKGKIGWTLSTICPSVVFGPVIHESDGPAELNVTAKWFYDILFNNTDPKYTNFPKFAWVDVRDVALAHIKAMEIPAADGQRFIASYEFSTWEYWLDLKKNSETKPPSLDSESTDFDNTKIRQVLSIQFTHGLKTLKDTETNFKSKGWIA